MAFRPNKHDLKLLTSLADYRALGIRQIAVLHQRNVQALRRRLNVLADHGFIEVATQGFGRGRGRPKCLVSIAERGIDLLRVENVLAVDVPDDCVAARDMRCLEHQLLVNELRLQVEQIPRLAPGLTTRFFAAASALVPRREDGRSLICEDLRVRSGPSGGGRFTPDGVFALAHAELGKTLLFFLEADMGTETLASPRRTKSDVRQKIVNYQAYFRLRMYKRYEPILGCHLKGFRLLLLGVSSSRFGSLCRLVREMPPAGFVWLTDRQSLLSHGAWAPIWTPGGRLGPPLESILGSVRPDLSPAPADLV